MLAIGASAKPQTSKRLEKLSNEAAVEVASKLSAKPLGSKRLGSKRASWE